jgi:hypothetical protein
MRLPSRFKESRSDGLLFLQLDVLPADLRSAESA